MDLSRSLYPLMGCRYYIYAPTTSITLSGTQMCSYLVPTSICTPTGGAQELSGLLRTRRGGPPLGGLRAGPEGSGAHPESHNHLVSDSAHLHGLLEYHKCT